MLGVEGCLQVGMSACAAALRTASHWGNRRHIHARMMFWGWLAYGFFFCIAAGMARAVAYLLLGGLMGG